MSSSLDTERYPVAVDVVVVQDFLRVFLSDGRGIAMPLSWYPRLCHGTPAELDNWELLGGGIGLSWPDLDEDIRVADVIDGIPAGESARSLGRWLQARNQNRSVKFEDIETHETTAEFR